VISKLRDRAGFSAAVLTCAAVFLTACGAMNDSASPAAGADRAPGFPVTVTSCGRTLTFDAPPERVVILSPMIARDLVALGVGDRVIGQSGTDYFAPPQETAEVPVLSKNNVTSTESILGARPDLVISDLAYRLDPAQKGASLDQLAEVGIQSYVAAAGCTPNYTEGRFDDVFTDLENLGKIFGVQAEAKQLAEDLRADVADVERRVAGQPDVSVFEGTIYGDQFYPVVGIGLEALDMAGGKSVFPVVEDPNANISKEEITARDPQAFVFQSSYPSTLDEQKEEANIKANFPTTAAARDDRIYFVGYFSSTLPGSAIETVASLRQVAEFLHPTVFQ
jgi:iron complex transport system substrate-binding protein